MILLFSDFAHEKTTFTAVELPESAPDGVDAWLRHDYLAANLADQTLAIRTQQQESLSIHVSGMPVWSLSFETLYHGDAADLFLRFVSGGDHQLVKIDHGQQTVAVIFDPPQSPLDVAVFAESYTHAANLTAWDFQLHGVPELAMPLWLVAAIVILFCFRRVRTPPANP